MHEICINYSPIISFIFTGKQHCSFWLIKQVLLFQSCNTWFFNFCTRSLSTTVKLYTCIDFLCSPWANFSSHPIIVILITLLSSSQLAYFYAKWQAIRWLLLWIMLYYCVRGFNILKIVNRINLRMRASTDWQFHIKGKAQGNRRSSGRSVSLEQRIISFHSNENRLELSWATQIFGECRKNF